MHWTVINSNWKIVKTLLKKDRELCQIKDRLGNSALHYLMYAAAVATEEMTKDEEDIIFNLLDSSDVGAENKVG